ncbi:MAG: hypothetical protein H7239_11020 [Flavobacterium sp.]|nr:hypothetical protein [Flavobacterium sp.]
MKTDLSLILYNKYFNLKNRVIEIELKSHKVKTGKFIGFIKGNKTYISKWHFDNSNVIIGIDTFGFLIGEIINQKSISKIKFLEDNTIMNF